MNKFKGFQIGLAVIAAMAFTALLMQGRFVMGAVCAVLFAGAWLQPRAELGTATLIVNILTGKIFDAFRTKVPELSYFSTDFGKTSSGFALPVKWNQEVISQIANVPTATDHTPGDDLSSGAVDVTTLVTDVKVKINRSKKVVLKLGTANAVSLQADGAFMQSLTEAGKTLARAVILDGVEEFNSQNFSQELEAAVADVDYDTLGSARKALNAKGAATPRYILGGSDFVGNIAADPRVASGDYHAQRTEADPYIELKNIEGFSGVREFPLMSDVTSLLGTCTVVAATNVITVSAAHGLVIGDRLRFTTTTTLPAGLSLNTDYYVLTVPSSTTLTVSATPSGSVVDITDTGTGTHSIYAFENLNAMAFEKRAIHVAFRTLDDNTDLANQLGIPKTFLVKSETDAETGLTVTVYLWQSQTTQDVYAALVVAYGIKAGRDMTGATTPALEAAGTGMDYAGLRIVEDAKTA